MSSFEYVFFPIVTTRSHNLSLITILKKNKKHVFNKGKRTIVDMKFSVTRRLFNMHDSGLECSPRFPLTWE